ncbi:MAG: response regulator transcription factor [Candidatus Acidiferrales bacterium]
MSVRILIADDHGVVRKGLRTLLESVKGWRVCAEATSGRDAVAEVKRYKPDVAILDIAMPGLNGVEAARQISKSSPQTRMLILSMHKSEKLVREVIEAGAHGYLLKDDADSDLVAAVDALRQHKPYFSFKVAQLAAREKKSSGEEGRRHGLTPRQLEIVQLLAEGKSNKEVATILNISVKTAETHRANIMLKLDLHSITDLVHYAIRNEIIHK